MSASNLQGEPQGQRVRLNQSAGRREERLETSTVLIGRVATSEPTTRCHSDDATTSAAIASGGGSSALSGSCCGSSRFSGRCPALPRAPVLLSASAVYRGPSRNRAHALPLLDRTRAAAA